MTLQESIDKALEKLKKPIPDRFETIQTQCNGEHKINLTLKEQIDQQHNIDKLHIINTIANCATGDLSNVLQGIVTSIVLGKNTISQEDVLQVAQDLKMDIIDSDILYVLTQFQETAENHPTDNWTEIVEVLLYRLKQ